MKLSAVSVDLESTHRERKDQRKWFCEVRAGIGWEEKHVIDKINVAAKAEIVEEEELANVVWITINTIEYTVIECESVAKKHAKSQKQISDAR